MYIVAAEVGLELPGQNLESGSLADTVCPDETEHLTRARSGKPMEFEGVCGVSVSHLGLEVGW